MVTHLSANQCTFDNDAKVNEELPGRGMCVVASSEDLMMRTDPALQ